MLGSRYGFAITPANQGGTDYAQGGARVTQTPGYPRRRRPGGAVPIATQVSQAVAKGIDGNALLLGPGRLQRPLHRVRPAAGRPDHVGAGAGQRRARRHATRAAGRHPEGERRELHRRHEPPRHRQDARRRSPPAVRLYSAQITAVTGLYNSTLNAALNQVGGNVIRLNAAGAAQRNPRQSGGLRLHQHDGAGLRRDAVAAVHAGRTWSPPTRPAPTCSPTAFIRRPPAHAILAQAVASMIEGPMQMAALAEAPLAVEQANFRALDGRMWSTLNSAADQQEVQRLGRVRLRHQRHRRHAGCRGNADLNTITRRRRHPAVGQAC